LFGKPHGNLGESGMDGRIILIYISEMNFCLYEFEGND
jgi:hypothetical protein